MTLSSDDAYLFQVSLNYSEQIRIYGRDKRNYVILFCYLETKDDGPYETQGETVIPIHNVM